MAKETSSNEVTKGEGFFHIDRRVWKLLCGRGDIQQASAYLTVAAGTGRGNKFSKWSAQAVEVYTGLHSSRAKLAIAKLIQGTYLVHAEESRRTVPIYELQSVQKVHRAALVEAKNSSNYEIAMDYLKGKSNSDDARRALAPFVLAGLVEFKKGKYILTPIAREETAELIWLPNSIVTGTSAQEPSPLKRLRSSGDLWALRLLIDLYHAQNLSADGGISRRAFQQSYTRKRYGKRGRHIVWGFACEDKNRGDACLHPATELFWEAAAITGSYRKHENRIWPAMGKLVDMGLVTCVPHLVENSALDCELLHGCAWDGSGELPERRLAQAAHAVGSYIIGPERLYTARAEGAKILVPVWDTQPDVQLTGIYRLTYRPQTNLTSDWKRRMNDTATEWKSHYASLGPQAEVKATGTHS